MELRGNEPYRLPQTAQRSQWTKSIRTRITRYEVVEGNKGTILRLCKEWSRGNEIPKYM